MTASRHTPVLLDETLGLLDPSAGQTALDCTVGLGGHAIEIARKLGPVGTLVICDLDAGNLNLAQERLRSMPEPPTIVPVHGNFAQAPRKMVELDLRVDALLADLGFASAQVDDPNRGFSFRFDGPLDMRLDPASPISAADLLRSISEEELISTLRRFGEEPRARRIAQKLIAARAAEPIETTARLASLVREATGPRRSTDRIDPATRTFQALRIAVNDELGSLDRLLEAVRRAAALGSGSASWLAPGARIAMISFHSLEDRPVKNCFRDLCKAGRATALTRKPLVARQRERDANPRSRSAKLRAIRLTEPGDAL